MPTKTAPVLIVYQMIPESTIVALVEGLSAALVVGSVQVAPLLILAAWAIAGTLVATRVFRWS